MGAYFTIGRATLHSTYVPRVGEVCRHEQPDGIPDRLVVGDGKTAAPDLPSLQPFDIYERVQRLEEEPRRSQSLTTLLETIVNALMQQQFLPRWHKETLSTTYKEFLDSDAMLRERSRAGQKAEEVDSGPRNCTERDNHSEKPNSSTLTDAEREAVEVAVKLVRNINKASRVFGCESQEDSEIELTLRGLLERLK